MAVDNDPRVSKSATNTIKNCVYNFEEQATVEKLIEVLSPFEKATRIVSTENTPTMQKIIPILVKIKHCLAEQ